MENNPDTNPGGDGQTIGETAADAGQKTGHMRWVLRIGTVLAILGIAAVWIIGTHH